MFLPPKSDGRGCRGTACRAHPCRHHQGRSGAPACHWAKRKIAHILGSLDRRIQAEEAYGRALGDLFGSLCTHDRAHLFGEVAYVQLRDDEFVVMPNHIHGIIWIMGDVGVGATCRVAPTTPRGPAPQSIGAIIGQFKSAVTKHIDKLPRTPGPPLLATQLL